MCEREREREREFVRECGNVSDTQEGKKREGDITTVRSSLFFSLQNWIGRNSVKGRKNLEKRSICIVWEKFSLVLLFSLL